MGISEGFGLVGLAVGNAGSLDGTLVLTKVGLIVGLRVFL